MTETLTKTAATELMKKAQKAVGKEGEVVVVIANPKKAGLITLRSHKGINGNEEFHYVDAKGQPLVKKFIKARTNFDLANPEHALAIYCLQNHPHYMKPGSEILRIENKEKEAKEFLEARDTIATVGGKIAKLDTDVKVRTMARVLKIRISKNDSSSVLKRAMYEAADNDPAFVFSRFEHEELETLKLLYDGLHEDVFALANKVWTFGSEVMGSSEEEAIAWLKDNDELIPSIRQKIVSE
ncbi:MAG: hypothetical protein ACTSPB_11245 [Candidatus Thorarchaeota archaeon]